MLTQCLEITTQLETIQTISPPVFMPRMRVLRLLAQLVYEHNGPELGAAFDRMIEALVED